MTRLAALVTGFGLAAATASAQEPVSIAIVNIDRVLSEARPIRAAIDEVDAQVAERQRALSTAEDELRRLIDTYRQQEAVLSEDSRSQMQRDIVERRLELDEMEAEIRTLINRNEEEVITPTFERVYQAIRAIAQQSDIDLVLRSDAAVFAEEDLDITQEVIDRLNAGARPGPESNLPESN